MRNNILKIFLSTLGVKYTDEYAGRLYWENPDRDNFFGLSYMLSVYGIEGKGFMVEDKGLAQLSVPFVAQTSKGFTVVSEIKDGEVYCQDEKGKHVLPGETFLQEWTGNVLLAQALDKAEEPGYEKNRKAARVEVIKRVLAVLSCLVIFAGLILRLWSSFSLALFGYLFLCGVGLFLSVLLLQRQLHVGSGLGDKLCSLFKESDCEEVSSSSASKTLLNISWSEVGLGYFLSNIILLSLSVDVIFVLGIVNILILPYTLWSLWYQKVKIRRWCTLCVFVQIVLWGLAIVFCLTGLYHSPFRLAALLALPFYCLAVLAVHYYAATKEKQRALEESNVAKRARLCREDVLFHFLKQQPYYEVTDEDSAMLAGNPEAEICLTLVCNPYCNPCAEAHRVIARMLKNNTRIKVRYVLTARREDLVTPSLYLISSYYKKGGSVFDEWYSLDVKARKAVNVEIEDAEDRKRAEEELSRHGKCVSRCNVKWTPTLLINGYVAPSEYSYEDIEYILFG